MTTGAGTGGSAPRPAQGAGAAGITIELSIECRDNLVAEALSQALMPDNRYFPKDQKFEASKVGSVIKFNVASPRARPAVSTVTSIISDAKLFRDVWVEVEATTQGLGRAPG